MSTLKRYQKEGGFEELLTLIETSKSRVQANILKSISAEDPAYAERVKANLLVFEDLFHQKEIVLTKLLEKVPPKVWAFALLKYDPEIKTKVLFFADKNVQFKIKDEFEIVENSTDDAQIISAKKKILGEARAFEANGFFKLVKSDETNQVVINTDATTQTKSSSSPTEGKTTTKQEIKKTTLPEGFVSFSVSKIAPNTHIPCNFYMHKDNKFVLCKKKGEAMSTREVNRLRDLKITHLFVGLEDMKKFY